MICRILTQDGIAIGIDSLACRVAELHVRVFTSGSARTSFLYGHSNNAILICVFYWPIRILRLCPALLFSPFRDFAGAGHLWRAQALVRMRKAVDDRADDASGCVTSGRCIHTTWGVTIKRLRAYATGGEVLDRFPDATDPVASKRCAQRVRLLAEPARRQPKRITV